MSSSPSLYSHCGPLYDVCCDYYPLITNKTQDSLTIQDAMMAHKDQYKLEPIYLHTPEQIEALLLLIKIALQMVVLIERTARETIRQTDKGL